MRETRPVVTLLRPRWVAGHLLVLVLTVSFIALGFWQLARNHHKQALVRRGPGRVRGARARRRGRDALAGGGRAQAAGHYDTAHEVAAAQPGARRQRRRRRAHSAACSPTAPRCSSTAGGCRRRRPNAPARDRRRDRVRWWCTGSCNTSSALSAQDAVTTIAGDSSSLPRVDLTRIGSGAALPAAARAGSKRRRRRPRPASGAPAAPATAAARPGEPHGVHDRVVLVRADRHHRLAGRARSASPAAAAASSPTARLPATATAICTADGGDEGDDGEDAARRRR